MDERITKLKSAGLSDEQISNILGSSFTSEEYINVRPIDRDPFIEIKGLPSGGRYYKNQMGIPTKLKGMPLKVRDAITLEAMGNSLDSALLDNIFEKRLSGVNPGDILVGDELYILAWLREQTFTRTPLIVDYTCDRCEHFNEDKVVSIDDLMVYNLPESITDPMSCVLPISEEEVKIRFMRRKDKVRIANHIKENDSLRTLGKDDIKLYEIASVMFGIGITDAVEKLESMDPHDFAVLNNFYIKMNFGFTQTAFMKCEKEECGYLNIVPVPFQSGFFLPKIGPDLSNQN
jgi:hypothetical protein